ncbi:MAG: hypothetical protein ACM32F_04445, partial [Betaproteobacteria bacterium]
AANSSAPGKVDPPKFDRAAFDVDFGQAYSGEQVRRTVVLNTSARGEAEFSLTIPNAPGFTITEVRVMGQGVTTPATSTTQMPLPSNTPRPLQDMAVRKVASSVKAPPWKVQFNGPSEVQVDVLYAPTFDAFKNTASPKMGVLNAALRNGAGTDGASIALRANFQGAALQPVVVPGEREIVAIVGEGAVDLSVAVTSTGQKGPAVVRLISADAGGKAQDVAVQLSPGQTTTAWLRLGIAVAPIPWSKEKAKQGVRSVRYQLTVDVSGDGFRAQVPLVLDVLDSFDADQFNCAGQIPALVSIHHTRRYDAASRGAKCHCEFSIAQSTDWFRKGGSFDWSMYVGNDRIVERKGFNYPGGAPDPSSHSFGYPCGQLTRDQYIRSYRRQDSWRLTCAPHT